MSPQKNILFINRDEEFFNNLRDSLRQSGYSVTTAADMREALSVLSANSIELIVCDNTLKDISGYDFLRFLKNDPLREKIPFIFCVPVKDQGRAMKAFKLGAADFIVYPLETEEIISRINETFPFSKTDNDNSVQPSTEINSPTPQMEKIKPYDKERREGQRVSPLPPIRVEVSRNGILWMPGQIKNISVKGMFLKTSLLGKSGVELYVRISLPSGTSVVKGRIKHIAFKNLDLSAGIGIEIEKSVQWREILKYLAAFVRDRNPPPSPTNPTAVSFDPPRNIDGTIILTGDRGNALKAAANGNGRKKSKEASYEIRFYQSLIGKQLNNYKVVSFIGSGAMGGVFKGWDIALERTVALKVISFELSAQEKFREMFIKEARLISKLDNKNIAFIYHIGNENQIIYFAMEYIEGATLAELIKRGDKFNTLKGLNYLITICEALDFLSEKNIIHRDIKPANIMINDKGIVKIVDFGVAKIVDVKENPKDGIVGSPFYISPDSIEGRPLDHRSDIYSLGASFYHAFTGFPPFEGKNADEILLKHINEELIPLKKKNPKVSNSVGRIIEKMMAKKPENRYQDYKGIIKDLKSLKSKALKFQKLKNATLIFRVKKK